MDNNITVNFLKIKLSLFFLPLFLLTAIFLFLYSRDALNVPKYIEIQKNCFLFLNSKLSQFPSTMRNLTQFGDTLIFLSLLSIFIVYAPKLWEYLLSALIVSAIFCFVFKKIFTVPRPAIVFDNDSFVIIGGKLSGFNSTPSGHSITVFTILTVLVFSFLPKKMSQKILCFFFIFSIGLILAFTRVGVGAHYPLDVMTGSIIGYISALIGIFISQEYKIWAWISNKKYYPIFITLFEVCCAIMIHKIINENLFIYYLALISLIVSLYKITYVYVKG